MVNCAALKSDSACIRSLANGQGFKMKDSGTLKNHKERQINERHCETTLQPLLELTIWATKINKKENEHKDIIKNFLTTLKKEWTNFELFFLFYTTIMLCLCVHFHVSFKLIALPRFHWNYIYDLIKNQISLRVLAHWNVYFAGDDLTWWCIYWTEF